MVPDLPTSLPKGFRVELSDRDCLCLSYRTTGMGCLGVFLVVFLVGWLAGTIAMTLSKSPDSPREAPLLVFVSFLTLFGGVALIVLAIFLWHFFATTTLSFFDDRLVAERSLGPFRRRRVIEKNRIRYVTQVKDGGVGEDSFPSWGLAVAGHISFKVLSRQRTEKSAWLGPIVADWAGVPFLPWLADDAAPRQAPGLAQPPEADLSRPPDGFRVEVSAEGHPVIVRSANGMGCLIPFLAVCFVIWVCPSVFVLLGLLTHALLGRPETVLWIVAALFLAVEFAFLDACLMMYFAETRFTLEPDRLLVQRRLRRTRTWWTVPRRSIRKVRQTGHYDDDLLTDCDLEVTTGIDTHTPLRHQSVEKSAWLGAIIGRWAGQPFIPLVPVVERVYETL